ncbi:MAG: extracellular solute-binding protein [Patescibacteria group bacterium]
MRKLSLAAVLISLVLFGFGCLGGSSVQIKPITLEYWRMDDAPETLAPVIAAYQKIHPNVTINVRTFRADEYDRLLTEALAEDRGPDIFSLPNVALFGWKARLLPLPEKTVVPTQVVDTDRQKIVAINQETKSLTKLELINRFVEAVEDDVLMLSIPTAEEKPTDVIWGLPYSVDTLALFYNVALLKQANIETPPTSWQSLQEQVKKLTVLDENGGVRQSGAAIGTAKNVRYSTDLLTAIMLQNGATMTDESGRPNFNVFSSGNSGNREYPPGAEALIFYQSFARSNMSAYTWDNTLPDSMDAFVAGKTAFYFGYPHDRVEIAQRAPQLDFEVASLPQVGGTVRNIAHYPVEVVSKKTTNPNEAWNFVQFATSEENVREFLRLTNRPTALRSLVGEQITDPEAKPFVAQLLTARSWYHGSDWSAVKKAFDTMIETYPTVEKPSYTTIVNAAVAAVNASMR